MRQLVLYLIVGAICFVIDIGGFVVLRLFELPILTASALSFVAATFINYALCCSFVFRRGRFSRPEEIVRLFMIALVGLALNSLVVLLLARILQLNPTVAKILAVLPVFAWNYLGRRKLVFDGNLSGSAACGARVRFDLTLPAATPAESRPVNQSPEMKLSALTEFSRYQGSGPSSA